MPVDHRCEACGAADAPWGFFNPSTRKIGEREHRFYCARHLEMGREWLRQETGAERPEIAIGGSAPQRRQIRESTETTNQPGSGYLFPELAR